MTDNRRAILEMLSQGKITTDEAERLLSALERPAPSPAAPGPKVAGHNGAPKFLRVTVDTDEADDDGPTKVNIRVPLALLRAGVRLSSVIPPGARDQVNAQLAKNGVAADLNQLKPENLEDLIEQLSELTVDVDQEKTKVRIYCE